MSDLPTNHRRGRTRGAALFVIIGLLFLAMLASSYSAWADTGPGLRRGTVPTPTPKGGKPTQPAPAAKPPPTRIVPPTRTPCLNCPTPAPLTFDKGLDILVNVGGPEYTDSAGRVWQADQEYVEGLTLWGFVLSDAESGTFTGKQPISGTEDAPLYQDERWAMAGYRFELPNGDYQVTLKFAEQYVKAPGKRAFNIKMQGTPVIKELDLVAAAGGPFIAVDRVVTVTVKNQLLAIDFEPVAENPTLAAIRITAIAGSGPSAAAPAGPTETPTATATATRVPRTPAPQTTATATPTETATPSHTPTTTPLPLAVRLTGLFPQYDAALRAPDGSVLVHVPAGSVPEAMSLLYIPERADSAPAANAGFQLGSVLFTLQPIDTAGTFISRTMFQQPIAVTVRYSAADLDAARGQPSRLIIGQYRPEAREWMALETVPDVAAGEVTARARRTGLFAVLIHTAPPDVAVGSSLTLSGHQGLAALGTVVVLGGLALLLLRLAVSRSPARAPRQAAAEAAGD